MTDIPVPLTDALRNRYLLERELGRGGMATVYLTRDLKHERPVALKVLLPELAAGASEFDGRSDLDSLGCVVYEMLTGEPPFTGNTPQSVIAKRFTDPAPPGTGS